MKIFNKRSPKKVVIEKTLTILDGETKEVKDKKDESKGQTLDRLFGTK